ncbi:facilitated trehalose transporter Tret1-2 homolog [Agrilus planipennis]|uniref:Facilitated trehalose transporter Tret1-2 homolog n=1 Tax=Agrilus planipennis TaxID=224129 RepID=A0A1W4WZ04_AGRPL|nr:facilitated trehalose transporter Tret1-2 homolog [Agrilus planipennis]XP_018325826.1 facilitated trehalose transporter Tret1-2 homolog [Agrilus planipennis]
MSTKCILGEEKLKNAEKTPQYIAALSVCLGALCSGTVLGWTGNTTDDLENGKFNNIAIDDESLGWIGSLANIGAALSCIAIGPLCEYMGRKYGMLLLVVPFTVGWLLVIFAQNVIMMYVGRILGGFAGGCFSLSAPQYVSETSQKEIRGTLSTFSELLLTVGVLIAYVLGYVLSAKTTAIILTALPIVFAIVFMTQPETPYYLLKRNYEGEALRSLQRLRGRFYDASDELKQIRCDIEEDRANELPVLQSFKKRETKIATLVSLGVMFFQQACGINAVVFYGSTIFAATGIDASILDPEISTIVIGAAPVLANCVSAVLIERLGRRTLLIISGLFMAIPEVIFALFFTFQDKNIISSDIVSKLVFLPILCLCAFVISSELGYGPVAWIISVEMFPAEVKSVLIAGTGAFNWFISFLITKFYLNMQNSVGVDVTFYIFAGMSFAGAVFPFFFVPETKGKSLVEIQRELRGK